MITFDALPILFSLSVLHPHPTPHPNRAENQHFTQVTRKFSISSPRVHFWLWGDRGFAGSVPQSPGHAFGKGNAFNGADHGDEHFVRAVAAPSTVRSRR